MANRDCPHCHSRNVKAIEAELRLFHCLDCRYNEWEEESAVAESRKSQREKRRFNPYKTGRVKRH